MENRGTAIPEETRRWRNYYLWRLAALFSLVTGAGAAYSLREWARIRQALGDPLLLPEHPQFTSALEKTVLITGIVLSILALAFVFFAFRRRLAPALIASVTGVAIVVIMVMM